MDSSEDEDEESEGESQYERERRERIKENEAFLRKTMKGVYPIVQVAKKQSGKKVNFVVTSLGFLFFQATPQKRTKFLWYCTHNIITYLGTTAFTRTQLQSE